MKTTLLDKIIAGESLNFKEAKRFIRGIDQGDLTNEEIAGILVGIQMRGIQLEEIKGFRAALIERAKPVHIDGTEAIDLCGTGGDGKNTFNISTTTAFLLAAMGIRVIKHGNYGVSSMCGSSNVLEALGVNFSTDSNELQRSLDTSNICFLHAPLFHPTMKKVAMVRRNLAVRTLFNCLGPLVNPVQPAYQLTGTYSVELAKIYQHVLKDERKGYQVVHGMNGYDEITLTDATRVLSHTNDFVIGAGDFNVETIRPEALHGGRTINEAAKMMRNILKGEGTEAQNQVVAANASVALRMYQPETNQEDLFHEALEFLQSGEVFKRFKLN